MKKRIFATALLVGTQAVTAYAGLNVNLNIGAPPPPPVVVAPAPPPVAPPPPSVMLEAPPQFIYSPELGLYVSVGVRYDIVYTGEGYYLYNGGYWYNAPYYNGPWVMVPAHRLPPLLRRHRFEDIRRFRDKEYRVYMRDREHYRGRMHVPEHREERRGERREERREERH